MDKALIQINFPIAFAHVSSAEDDLTAISTPQITCRVGYLDILQSTPLNNSWNSLIKRGFDILISMVLIICVLSWLIPLLSIFIKLDSAGTVFFLQKRNKNGGRLFTCIKFRSMHENNDADILAATENDKRITKVGKFLRDYHIDELPQLFNVLAGDMSIIGPRPHMISENVIYANMLQEYDYRHTVKPGITGLAQSIGNFGATGDIEKIKERVRLDIQYINKWSLAMDIKILYRTSLIMLGLIKLKK